MTAEQETRARALAEAFVNLADTLERVKISVYEFARWG
jgi:hypothetical protein